MPRKPKVNAEGEGVAKIASIEGTASPDVAALLEQIEGLKDQLKVAAEKRDAAEQAALESAKAQGQAIMQQTDIQEVATGKKIKIARLTKYETVGYKDDGRPILKPVFHQEEVPTFFYKISLPPVGGLGLTVNGLPLYHDTVYEFDLDTLRSVKDMVFKCWKHEADIHGNDDNAFGRETVRQKAARFGVGSPV